jgi:hypothetical protein
MNINELTPSTYIQVIEIFDWGYIPEIKRYGPCKKTMCTLGEVVNMLNRGVTLKLAEHWIEPVYLFIKQYNLLIEKTGLKRTKALNAESLLYKELYHEAKVLEDEEDIKNPLVDINETKDIDKIQKTIIDNIPIKIHRTHKIIKKPRLYETFENTKVEKNDENLKFYDLDIKN